MYVKDTRACSKICFSFNKFDLDYEKEIKRLEIIQCLIFPCVCCISYGKSDKLTVPIASLFKLAVSRRRLYLILIFPQASDHGNNDC